MVHCFCYNLGLGVDVGAADEELADDVVTVGPRGEVKRGFGLTSDAVDVGAVL